MFNRPPVNRRRRSLMQSLLISPLALSGIGMAQAQVSTPATPARISTVYTGDVINGKKVVSSLNTDELEPGKKHLLYFQGVQMSRPVWSPSSRPPTTPPSYPCRTTAPAASWPRRPPLRPRSSWGRR